MKKCLLLFFSHKKHKNKINLLNLEINNKQFYEILFEKRIFENNSVLQEVWLLDFFFFCFGFLEPSIVFKKILNTQNVK